MSSDVAVCAAATIVAKSFLSFARVLATSFRRHNPGIPFYVLLADEVDGYFDPVREPFEMVGLDALQIPQLERFRFNYTQQPLSYAATPYLLEHLLRKGHSRVVFLKQESLVLDDFASFYDRLGGHSVVVTPHLITPLDGADRVARELNILQSGTFNIGMLGVADTESTARFLRWWQDRVFTHCRHAVAEGMHFEQRWIDLAPALFEGVHILRDPAYNVGHWNLPERVIEVDGEKVTVDGVPCRLFRFSGYHPERPDQLTMHSRRLTADNAGPAVRVFERFRLALEDAGYHETKTWPYAYAAFDNGVAIPDVARLLYLRLGEKRELQLGEKRELRLGAAIEPELGAEIESFGDPRATDRHDSFFAWLNGSCEPAPVEAPIVSRLWQAVHRSRRDLQLAFPDPLGADRAAFLDWTVQSGLREHAISDRFLVHQHG